MASIPEKKYKQSEKVKNAYDAYSTYKTTKKPTDYSFSDSELLKQTQNKYLNAPDFKYDAKTDPLYKQYESLYRSQGKKAMEDAMGEAAALTGGYGNSYAQSAGSGAYNEYLSELNNLIPDLYEAAYSKYSDDLDRLESQLAYLSQKDESEYSKYIDAYNQYSNEVDNLLELYLNEYKYDVETQNNDWEAAYKIAMAEQQKEIADADRDYKYYQTNQEKAMSDANIAYKYYEADQKQSQFDKELEYKTNVAESDAELRKNELDNKQEQYWNDYNAEQRKTEAMRDDEILTLLRNGNEYEAMVALDHKYSDKNVTRSKAILMGFDPDYVDSYIRAYW